MHRDETARTMYDIAPSTLGGCRVHNVSDCVTMRIRAIVVTHVTFPMQDVGDVPN